MKHKFTKKYRLYDDRYGLPGIFDLLKCKKCNHAIIDKKFSEQHLSELYTNYYPRSEFKANTLSLPRKKHAFSSWLDGEKSSAYRWVPKNVRVLDIGCGYGQTLLYHEKRGCEAYGIELDENVKDIAERSGLKIEVGAFNSDIYKGQLFDYITMDQVLEHMIDPLKTLRNVKDILKPEGIVIITFPNIEGWGSKIFGSKWINWHAPYHLHFFSKKSLARLVEDAGFVIIKDQTITSSSWLNYQWKHLLFYPSEGEPSKFWAPHKLKLKKYTLRERLILKILNLINKIKINHVVTRLFDLLQLGDNRLVIIKKL